jgi:hypothetical protein
MVHSIEYGGQWVAPFGLHIEKQFTCAIIGVYAGIIVHERRELWEELRTLQAAFVTPLFIVGDFNETLHQCESNSGYLNGIGSTDFKRFISNCNLLEYPLSGHRYTRFHGNSMWRTDRAFATPYFHLTFSGLLLSRFPQEFSDHCPMIL